MQRRWCSDCWRVLCLPPVGLNPTLNPMPASNDAAAVPHVEQLDLLLLGPGARDAALHLCCVQWKLGEWVDNAPSLEIKRPPSRIQAPGIGVLPAQQVRRCVTVLFAAAGAQQRLTDATSAKSASPSPDRDPHLQRVYRILFGRGVLGAVAAVEGAHQVADLAAEHAALAWWRGGKRGQATRWCAAHAPNQPGQNLARSTRMPPARAPHRPRQYGGGAVQRTVPPCRPAAPLRRPCRPALWAHFRRPAGPTVVRTSPWRHAEPASSAALSTAGS